MVPQRHLRPTIHETAEPNLVPTKPFLKLQVGTPRPGSTLSHIIKELFDHYMAENKAVVEQNYLAGAMVANFIEGNQVGRPSPTRPGQWLSWEPQSHDQMAIRQINLTQFWAQNNLWKWLQSNPDIVATAGIDTDEAQESADAADLITDHYEKRFWTPFVSIQECLQGLCWGTYVERIRYDPSIPSMTVYDPIYEPRVMQIGQGLGICGNCGFRGTARDFQQVQQPQSPEPVDLCPQCNELAHVSQPAQDTVQTAVGTQPIQLGDFILDILPFPSCRWDFRYRVHESSWFIHRRQTTKEAVLRLLGNVNIPSIKDTDVGLNIIDKLAWLKQSLGGQSGEVEIGSSRGKSAYRDPVTIDEISLGPDCLYDRTLSKDEDTLAGEVIPKGPLLNSFPEGLTAFMINGQLVINLARIHHSQNTKNGVWHAKVSSGTGRGFHDAIELQRRFNTENSQLFQAERTSGTPAMLVLADAIPEEDRQQYLGTPGANIPVLQDKIPEGKDLSDIVHPAFIPTGPPTSMYNSVYKLLPELFQYVTMNTDWGGAALPGTSPKTKYAAQVKQANAHALLTPNFQVKGETRMLIMYDLLHEYPKRFPMERKFPLEGKHSRQIFKAFTGSKLDPNVVLDIVRNSELPRNLVTLQEDAQRFFAMVGGAAGAVQLREADPKFYKELQKKFNVQLGNEPVNSIKGLCLKRIRQMSAVAGLVQDPMMLILNIDPEISALEPEQQAKAVWLMDWLDQDDAQAAPMNLRHAVELLIQIHHDGHGTQGMALAFQQGMMQTAGAVPGAMAQMAQGAIQGAVQQEQNPPQPAKGVFK